MHSRTYRNFIREGNGAIVGQQLQLVTFLCRATACNATRRAV